jgi:U2 small nuclear ribonucleoprotein A'
MHFDPSKIRLKTLNLCNNRISKIHNIGDSLPGIENLVLVNNKVSDLRELENLMDCKCLTRLYLNGNPVASLPNYRIYTAFLIPSLRVLDFQKITKKVVCCFKKKLSERVNRKERRAKRSLRVQAF